MKGTCCIGMHCAILCRVFPSPNNQCTAALCEGACEVCLPVVLVRSAMPAAWMGWSVDHRGGCELSTKLANRNTVGFLGICRGFVVEQVSIACCMAQCCACSLLRYLTACLCLPGLLLASRSV